MAVPAEDAIRSVEQGKIDVLCDATFQTLTLRKTVSFSIPVFASGTSAVIRKDASQRLHDVLSGRTLANGALWRGNSDQLIRQSTVSVVSGSRAEKLLDAQLAGMEIIPNVAPVPDYASGVARVLDGRSNVLLGDRAVLVDAVRKSASPGNLQLVDRFYSHESLSLVVPREDEDLRLVVDRALARFFRSDEFRQQYPIWFGPPSENGLLLFQLLALPE